MLVILDSDKAGSMESSRVLRKIGRGLGILVLAGTSTAANTDWPPLPSQGFISGRPAQATDVQNGDAIFVAAVQGKVIGKPLPIKIPQYAYVRDTHERVILVQAEDANGIKLFGVRGLDGKEAVVRDGDLELLGTQKPN